MKPQQVDFHHIEPHQAGIHERLRNWARWVSVRPQRMVHPMFKMYRAAQHWDPKEFREPCDLIDAQAMEKVVGTLPPPHAFALRWAYVYSFPVGVARRELATSNAGLQRYVRDGRQMLVNLAG
jgi:hypothetical protein